jgi:site-specific DNA recombinase
LDYLRKELILINSNLTVAIYARVSSEQQAEAKTIDSQICALKERVAADSYTLDSEFCFIDDGYSGATLIRPPLECLRDTIATGAIDILYVHSPDRLVLYVHSPDRLARKYAYQVLLVDEFHRSGIQLIFLTNELGQNAEQDLLLQVQGMVAEYERAKMLERSRRGKRHAAHQGSVSVLSGAPYGYRYITKEEGGGGAAYQIVDEEADVVAKVFEWVGMERISIGEACRRLNQQGVLTRTKKARWDRATVWGLLGIELRFGVCSRILPIRGQPPSAKPKLDHGNHLYGLKEGVWSNLNVSVTLQMFQKRNGFTSQCQQSLVKTCLKWCNNN